MIKLIYSDSLDPGIGAGAFLMTGNGELKKAASSVFDCPPDLLKAPKGFVPVHLVALGDEEAFGPNRNADGFPKYANEKYHGTFVTHGHVYEHHRNTDPKKSIGSIVKSAHSPAMSRIELFIHANENKAEKHLTRMEKEGSIPVSMACKVPNDRCYLSGTQVLTPAGNTAIETLKVGDMVLTHQGNICKISEIHINSFSGTVMSITGAGVPTIRMTDNHPCFVIRKERLRSKAGRRYAIGQDNIAAYYNRDLGDVDTNIELVDARDLCVGDYWVTPVNFSGDDSCGVDPTTAYLAGVYAGDGYQIKQRRGKKKDGESYNRGVAISCGSTDKHIPKIVALAETVDSISAISIRYERDKNAALISLSGKEFAHTLREIVGEYSHTKGINLRYLATRQSRLAFIGGMIDSDGSQDTVKGSIRICTISQKLAYDLRFVCLSVGIPASLHRVQIRHCDSGYRHTSQYMWVVFIAKGYAELLSEYAMKVASFESKNVNCRGFFWGGYYCSPITKISEDMIEDITVHNLSVIGDETYIAGGVSTHNCSICNTLRKTAEDPSQCAHVRDHLGEMDNKGSLIYVHNDQPTYFDISLVGRPADRTAYGFHAKMASAGVVSSIKLAEDAGVAFPESLSIESPEAHRRFLILKKMAQFEDYYKKILTKPLVGSEYRFYELAKAAFSSLDDSDMESLRNWGPEVVFPALQKAACILPVRDFYKYAFGADYGELAQYMPAVIQTLRNGWYSELYNSRGTDAGLVCEEDRYTKEASVYTRSVDRWLMSKIAERLSFTYQSLSDRAITNTLVSKRPELVLIKIGGSTNSMEIISYLCTKYASYKISTLSKVITCPGVNEDEAIAVAVAQDLVNS